MLGLLQISAYCTYTVRSKFLGQFFNRGHMRKSLTFLIQNKLHCHIYRLLRGRTISEKLLKIPIFEPS